MSFEAKEIGQTLNQLFEALNDVAGDAEKELDVLHGFLEYYSQKLWSHPSKLSLLKADAQQMLTELDIALKEGKDCAFILQQAHHYHLMIDDLSKNFQAIFLTLGN